MRSMHYQKQKSEDEIKFRKTVVRDFWFLVGIFILSGIALFLIPFIAYLGQKGGW
jgi:heme/copper-type cytochrome/quinol oxidase subunit 3